MNMNVNNVCFMIRMFLMVYNPSIETSSWLVISFPFLLYMFVFTGPMPWPYQIFWIAVYLIPITFDTVVFSITTQSILVPFTSRVSSATAFTPVTSVLVLMPAKFKVMV